MQRFAHHGLPRVCLTKPVTGETLYLSFRVTVGVLDCPKQNFYIDIVMYYTAWRKTIPITYTSRLGTQAFIGLL